jgi:hypothetical protein
MEVPSAESFNTKISVLAGNKTQIHLEYVNSAAEISLDHLILTSGKKSGFFIDSKSELPSNVQLKTVS